MLEWLRKKAAQQSLFNVQLNASSLILDANRADAVIHRSGSDDPAHTKRVVRSQKALLADIRLALQNGATLQEVQARIATARTKTPPTQGAEMAIAHVLTYLPQQD